MISQSPKKQIILPHNDFRFRWYQAVVQDFLVSTDVKEKGVITYPKSPKFVYAIWHRKAGKDECMLHIALQCMLNRVGNYLHLFPKTTWAKKAIWRMVNPHSGRNRIDDVFPKELIAYKNEQEMFIRLINGSTIQFGGFDEFDSLVGALPIGIIMSEYATSNYADLALDKFMPQIENVNGFIALVTTPRGRNHAFELWNNTEGNPNWLRLKVTAEDSGVYTQEKLEQIKLNLITKNGEKAGITEFNQEYMVDFTQSVSGSFYSEFIEQARDEGRILEDMQEDKLYNEIIDDDDNTIYASFDIGVRDSTAIWIAKVKRGQVIVYDYYENHGQTAQHYMEWLEENHTQRKKILVMPHDVRVREWVGGSRIENIKKMGYDVKIAPMSSVDDAIHITKKTIPLVHFDGKRCYKGIHALNSYHQNYDEKSNAFTLNPVHDWSSHGASSFQYLCLFLQEKVLNRLGA